MKQMLQKVHAMLPKFLKKVGQRLKYAKPIHFFYLFIVYRSQISRLQTADY